MVIHARKTHINSSVYRNLLTILQLDFLLSPTLRTLLRLKAVAIHTASERSQQRSTCTSTCLDQFKPSTKPSTCSNCHRTVHTNASRSFWNRARESVIDSPCFYEQRSHCHFKSRWQSMGINSFKTSLQESSQQVTKWCLREQHQSMLSRPNEAGRHHNHLLPTMWLPSCRSNWWRLLHSSSHWTWEANESDGETPWRTLSTTTQMVSLLPTTSKCRIMIIAEQGAMLVPYIHTNPQGSKQLNPGLLHLCILETIQPS